MSEIKNGDTVTYERAFGDKRLKFVGHAKQLQFSNDAVVTHDGDCVPVNFSGLKKIELKDLLSE